MNRISYPAIVFFIVVMLSFPAFRAGGDETVPPAERISWRAFSDVPEGYWAEEKIDFLSGKGYLKGYSDGTFRPGEKLTRAELAAVLTAISGQGPGAPDRPSFSDTGRDQWFFASVESAKTFFAADPSLGMGLFRPWDPVTRQEAVAAVVRAKNLRAGPSTPDIKAQYKDWTGISPEYRETVTLALGNGVAGGYPDSTFRPGAPLSRAEAASIVYNAVLTDVSIENLLKTGSIKAFDQTQEGYSQLAGSLGSSFGSIEGVDISFFVREITAGPGGVDRLILVFARVDPFKYFTFSDAIFSPQPEKVLAYAQKISAEVSRAFPKQRNVVMVGFYDVLLYDTAPEVYGPDYALYSPPDRGWRVERFYAGAMGLNGNLAGTWLEPGKA